MNERIALIVNPDGSFEVRVMHDSGYQQQLSWGVDLAQCMVQAAQAIGRPLLIPVSGPNTRL